MSVYRNGVVVLAGVELKYYGITLKKQLTVWQHLFKPSPFFGLSPALWLFSFHHDLSDLYRICTRFRFCDQGQSTGEVTKDLEGNLVVKGDFETQARQVFTHLKNILEEAEGRIQNIVKMTAFLTHFDYIETYRKFRDEFMQEPFSPNSAVFKHCDGKRNKIRWLKVHITTPGVLSDQWFDLELGGFETPKDSTIVHECWHHWQVK